MGEVPEDYDLDGPDDRDCPNCGGEGFVAHCWEEWACIDPEGGCDDCLQPCDWCSPPAARAALTQGQADD